MCVYLAASVQMTYAEVKMSIDYTDIVRLSDGLAERKPPNWLIDGILEHGTFSAIVAAAGNYKSFIALDMAHSIAHGIDWHGRKTKQGSVVYCVGEGLQGVYARSLGWHTHHGLDSGKADLYLLKIAKGLQDADTAKALYEVVKEHTNNNPPKLIIIDTLSRYSTGIDENSNSDMAKFIETITNELSLPLNCSVVLVHHTGKVGSSARGASALNGALDAEWSLSKSGLTATMKNTKSKDHAMPDALVFEMLTTPIEPNSDLMTLVPKLVVNSFTEGALTVEQELRGEGKARTSKAEALFAYLQDTYDGEGSLTNLEASTISVAIATENLSRNWRTMINNIQIKRPDFEIRAETLAEVLGQLETYFEASKTS